MRSGDCPTLPVTSDFMSFRRMVTPMVIQILFVLGCVAALIAGIAVFAAGIKNHHTREAILGVGIFLFGPLVVRILCGSDDRHFPDQRDAD